MGLPKQKIPISQKTEDWKKDTVNYYERLSYSSTTSNRNTNYNKRINYDLFNGKFNKADLEYVCNPLGMSDNEFPATLQHYDVVSPPLNLLSGEESKRNDNFIVYSESPTDINRKQKGLKDKIIYMLQKTLAEQIDPSADPNQKPETPADIIKYEKDNVTDLVESQANKILKYVKHYLNLKEIFKKGWKDALIAGEEIYWVGAGNDDLMFRRCNPLNTTIILDGDTEYVDDALAVVEVRLLAPATIIDEFGKDLKPSEIDTLEALAKRYSSAFNMNNPSPTFTIDNHGSVIDNGITGFTSINSTAGSFNSELIRVVRVEWKSFKKLYHLTYTDPETELEQEQMVDESFKISVFRQAYPDAKIEEFWINEAWEGIKIGDNIFVNIQPKENQRRRMDNPYYCKLGYIGLIYNSTNSKSVSLLDRLKPYQYLYNIISYRLELAFASDQGKVFLMDLAQIPQSQGMDIDKWMYYLKAMKIAFINSHEEGRKGSMTGKVSTFNQFQSVDLSLANQIQQYIQTLDYIKTQIAFISGVSPQRLGAINNQELVGNVERSVQQSALITEYLFVSHDEVKRRCYTALIEAAKVAFRKGKKAQYVLDNMGLEMLDIEEFELEASEFNVYVSNSSKDLQVVETLKQLAAEALKSDKADLSTIIDTVINDNPRDILRNIQRGEAAKYARDKQIQDQQAQIQQAQIAAQNKAVEMQMNDKQKDRDLNQYIADTNNETKIQVAEINVYSRQENLDQDNDGIPDPIELASLSLQERDLASKAFMEQSKLDNDKKKHNDEITLKEKELQAKKEIEDKKIEAIKVQNANQIELANKKHKADKELADKKIQLERMKINKQSKTKK